MPLGLISFIAVHAKGLKLVPNFIKILNKIECQEQISFKAPYYDHILICIVPIHRRS